MQRTFREGGTAKWRIRCWRLVRRDGGRRVGKRRKVVRVEKEKVFVA
jgi:hypothetical protein